MTRGNQRELARQKNMKKQSDSVKGKRRDDGLSAAARKQRKYTQTYYAAVPVGWWGSGGGPATQPAAGGRWRFLHILGTQPQSH
ncbi:SERF2 isoform 4 [Pongo abelii]|uniref:SERF2 isoform 4 n=1 Tax=Pongo abelii TaxID=9601 RepID=A0A2J8S4F2_PONAB|nr:SERF2 isoform 4 [Pongo abelii]